MQFRPRLRRKNADLAKSTRLRTVAATAALDATTADIVRRLRLSGVPVILLRGPAIATWLYPGLGERAYSDIDLLVPSQWFAEGERTLASAGFHESRLEGAFPRERPGHAHTWFGPGGRAVDLHRTLVGAGVPPQETWNVLAEGTESVVLEGVAVEIPALAARLVVIALHAAHHAGEAAQPAVDLDRAVEQAPLATWRSALDVADRLAARPGFAAGLRTTPAGRDLAARLRLEPTSPLPSTLVGGSTFHVAQAFSWLAQLPGVNAKVAFAARKLAPTPMRMRARSGLARRGAAGLAAAYVVRWLSALRHASSALRTVRRSR